MTKTFNGGDHVSWDLDGRVTGRIRSDTDGFLQHAGHDE